MTVRDGFQVAPCGSLRDSLQVRLRGSYRPAARHDQHPLSCMVRGYVGQRSEDTFSHRRIGLAPIRLRLIECQPPSEGIAKPFVDLLAREALPVPEVDLSEARIGFEGKPEVRRNDLGGLLRADRVAAAAMIA